MLCNEANKNWVRLYAASELLQQQSVMGASIFRSPTRGMLLRFQVCWADQLSSLWVVDTCPNFAVEPWPSSIIFISMGDLRGPYQEQALALPVTLISTPGDARSTRSQSVHPPPGAPLPIQNWPPKAIPSCFSAGRPNCSRKTALTPGAA